MKRIMEFLRDEEGVTAIEYALIAALIAVAIIAALGTLGGDISATFNEVAQEVATAGE